MAGADIRETFGPLPDRRTGNHMENHQFYWSSQNFYRTYYIFFNIRVPTEGLPTGIFYQTGGPAQWWFSSVLHCFHRSRTEDWWISLCLPEGCCHLQLSVCLAVRLFICLSFPIILVDTIAQSVYPIYPPNLQCGFKMALSCMVL